MSVAFITRSKYSKDHKIMHRRFRKFTTCDKCMSRLFSCCQSRSENQRVSKPWTTHSISSFTFWCENAAASHTMLSYVPQPDKDIMNDDCNCMYSASENLLKVVLGGTYFECGRCAAYIPCMGTCLGWENIARGWVIRVHIVPISKSQMICLQFCNFFEQV